MSRQQTLTAAFAVFLVVAVLPMGIGVAAADTAQTNDTNESNPIDGFLEGENTTTNETDDGLLDIDLSPVKKRLSAISAGVRGQIARATGKAKGVFAEEQTNKDRAAKFQKAVNGNASTYKTEANARDNVEVTEDHDVHEVIIAHEDSAPATVYVVGDLNTSTSPNTVNSFIALNESEFNATNRSVDETWLVEDQAANNLDVLVGEVATKIQGGGQIGDSYQTELIGKYCGASSLAQADRCDIRSTIWLDTTQEKLRNESQET